MPRRSKFLEALAQDPSNVKLALRKARLPISLAAEAEFWDESLLARRTIREALDKHGANADFVATKLKAAAETGNVKAIELICKLRGYNEPIGPCPTLDTAGGGDALRRDLEARDRIVEVLGLRYYPVAEAGEATDLHPGGSEGAAEAGDIGLSGAEEGGTRIGEPQTLLGEAAEGDAGEASG